MPRISVIMGVYKEKNEYIRLAVDSILGQTYSDFEFIIVLDAPDNAEALRILNEYKRKDERIIVVVNESNIGLAMSLNKAMKIARGEYFARMDADDFSHPTRFEKQIECLDAHPEISVLGTNKRIMDEDGKVLSKGGHLPTTPEGTEKVLKLANVIVHPSVMVRAKDIKGIGGYRDFPTTQDFDLWLRVLTSGLKISNLDDHLIDYRINNQGISMSKAYRQALVGEYIRKLEKERRTNGKDSFSKENLLQFLADNRVDDQEEAQKFQTARAVFEDGRIRIKSKHILSGLIRLFRAVSIHPLMKKQVKNTLMSSIVKRGAQ